MMYPVKSAMVNTSRNNSVIVPSSKVVPCAVILQVLDLRPFVTITENSYKVFGFKPVTKKLNVVVLAVYKKSKGH